MTSTSKNDKQSLSKPTTKKTEQLTLFDRLSHLTYKQACDILSSDGAGLLRRSFPLDSLDAQNDIFLDENIFRLSIHEPWGEFADVVVTLTPGMKHKLGAFCLHCNPGRFPNRFCEHTAATLQFLLEEKTLIGLAAVPDLETPPELLSEKKLRERALHERAERSRNEKYRIKAEDKSTPWTDYLITGESSGKTYRVALRGREYGDSYCSCPDFRANSSMKRHSISHISIVKQSSICSMQKKERCIWHSRTKPMIAIANTAKL